MSTTVRSEPARNATEFVQLVREFLEAHAALRAVFESAPAAGPRFADLAAVVGDDHGSALYRVKQRSHALFRSERLATETVRREVLFDLTVGALFHEAMKLRETLYQREVYAPRVASLRDASAGETDPLLGEFERLLERSAGRLDETLAEVRVLLVQTRDQFRRVLVERAGERGVTRCLLSRREEVAVAFPEGFEGLLEAMHGEVAVGLIEAARAYLDSAYFEEAARTLREAERAAGAPRREITRLEHYAEGMQAFLDADYQAALSALEGWADLGGHEGERSLARRASAALGRLERLLEDGPGSERLIAIAKQLQVRLDTVAS